jgi:hypothetical protein
MVLLYCAAWVGWVVGSVRGLAVQFASLQCGWSLEQASG